MRRLSGYKDWVCNARYQSCRTRVSVGRVSVFGLRCCGWCWWGVGGVLGLGFGKVGWC